jgi:general secretion pathway protein C
MEINLRESGKRWLALAADIVANPLSYIYRMQPIFVLLAITVLSFFSVVIIYNLLSFPLLNQALAFRADAPLAGSADVLQRSPLSSYGIIIQRNLFLSTLKTAGEKQLSGGFFGSGPEATAFELKGTIAGDSSFGFAVIEEKGKNKQNLYKLGDMVGSNKLVKITRNSVVLKNSERNFILKIKETPEGQLLARSPDTTMNPSSSMALSRQEMDEKLGDLKTVLSQALVRPFFTNGVQEGFIITDIKPASLYQKLGLQNGDIIMEVNNKQVKSADDVFQFVTLMRTGGSVSLNLKRNGIIETINYSFQ